ncbi:MAG TPA: phosphoglucosamine mutase [Acidisarcina sp.]
MRKLFGTDGIRAIAGEPPLDPETVHAIGIALAHSLKKDGIAPQIILGADTRESSAWISAVIAAGLGKGGATVVNAGVITTPGIAFLARKLSFAAGVVISASHNPWQDNGIKIFGADGFKLADSTELQIEEEIFRRLKDSDGTATAAALPAVPTDPHLLMAYEEFLSSIVPALSLAGKSLVVDCANGAASALAEDIFKGLGGDVHFINTHPNGRNINDNCGALYPKTVAAATAAQGADIGITFDGDADRVLFADAYGQVVNGDAVLLLAARDMQQRKLLTGGVVVATTMSNMGLEAALTRTGIRMLRAPVGDKYVLEMMQAENAALGGEQSGHILFPHLATTGDGLLTALVVLDIVQRSGKRLHELTADLKVFPQVIVNIPVREKRALDQIPAIVASIRDAEEQLEGSGRVVVRYSGTESLARVMIEAESEETMRYHAHRIADAIRQELGT